MINFQNLGNVSPIALTLVLLVYLMIVELGNKKLKKALFPFVLVLCIVFLILAINSIYSTYINIK
jgi:hypothetical protein